jgi:hypothetical protein
MKSRNTSKISFAHHRVKPDRRLVEDQKLGLWDRAAAMESFVFIPLEYSLIFFPSGRENRFR